MNFDRALYWLNVGAIPTDTVRNILSREGVMLMKHLQGGVKKGAFNQEEAQRRFDAWKAEKDAKLEAVRNNERESKKAATKQRLEDEAKKNEAKAEAVAQKRAEIAKLKPRPRHRLPPRHKPLRRPLRLPTRLPLPTLPPPKRLPPPSNTLRVARHSLSRCGTSYLINL